MAWNDPPSFDYQQLANSGRKFKHRYVLDSKIGHHQTANHFQQPPSSRDPMNDQQSLLYQNQASSNGGSAQQTFSATNFLQHVNNSQSVNQVHYSLNGAQVQQPQYNSVPQTNGANNNFIFNNSSETNTNDVNMNQAHPMASPIQPQHLPAAQSAMGQQENK